MTKRGWIAAGVMALAVPAPQAAAQDGPTYATPETRDVIEKMLGAHGGYARWRDAPTVSFDNVFFNPFAGEGQNPWWISHQVIEQKTRRVYQDWPQSGGELAYAGDEVWVRNWGVGNHPVFETYFFYWFVNLPWLTQEPYVSLGPVGTDRLPGYDKDFHTVRLEFATAPSIGKNERDAFELFIDPDDGLLRGYRYWVAWGPMLDAMRIPEGEIFGPMLRVHDTFGEFDGVVVPIRFHTMAADGSQTYGHHTVLNYSLTRPFDESRLEKPADAMVDEIKDVRRSATESR